MYNSVLGRNARVDRNNFILHSSLGNYTCTGQFNFIMHSEIDKYCSIFLEVTIGAGEHDYNKIMTHDFLYNKKYEINDDKVSCDRF